MIRRAIALLITLALSLPVVPRAATAQPVGKVYQIGCLAVAARTNCTLGSQ
jgi:hypothetical protein